jgi:hypothetical protein
MVTPQTSQTFHPCVKSHWQYKQNCSSFVLSHPHLGQSVIALLNQDALLIMPILYQELQPVLVVLIFAL